METSCTSSLPWIWIIEALACSSQLDATILYDLVKRIPEICSDLGKNARELVFLRILEQLFVIGARNANPVSSSSSSKIAFDPSESCEYVLECLSRKTSVQNLIASGLDTLNWDVQPFIEHKRSHLPKCALQQLNDAILTGSHPVLDLLREHSRLAVTNQSKHRLSADEGDTNQIAARPKECNTNPSNVAAKGHLISHAPANEDALLKKNLPDENLLVSKRNRSASTENSEARSHENQTILENVCEDLAKAAKKYKHDIILGKHDADASLVSSNAGKTTPGCCKNEQPSSKGLVGHDEVPCKQLVPHSDTKVPKEKSCKIRGQENHLDQTKGDKEGLCELRIDIGTCGVSIQSGLCNGKDLDGSIHGSQQKVCNVGEGVDDIDYNQAADTSWDSKEYNDEETDIAMKKIVFLSSQCTYSQDSIATTDYRELNLCSKCKMGGTLLVCSSIGCRLMVHEACLGSAATFDAGGEFYCPFCAYSRALSKLKKSKDNVFVARKDLATFFRMGNEEQTEEVSLTSGSESQRENANLQSTQGYYKVNDRNISTEAKSSQHKEDLNDDRDAEPSVSCAGDRLPRGIPSTRVVERSNGNEHAEVRSKKEVSSQAETGLAHQSRCSHGDGEQISDEENGSSGASEYCIRYRNQEG